MAVKGGAEFWIIFKENWNETLFHFCFKSVNVSTHCACVYMKVWATAFPPTQTNNLMRWPACVMLFNHVKQWCCRQMLSSSRCFSGAPPPRRGSVCVLFMTTSTQAQSTSFKLATPFQSIASGLFITSAALILRSTNTYCVWHQSQKAWDTQMNVPGC